MLRLLLPVTGDLGLELRLLVLGSTYFSHSLLWAAAVALLTHSRRMPASTSASMWKMALFGPLLTTVLSASVWPALERTYGGSSLVLLPYLLGTSSSASDTLSLLGSEQTASAHSMGEPFWRWLVLAWAGASLLGLSRFVGAACRIFESLRGREPSANERAHRLLQRLVSRARLSRVQLTESNQFTSPISLGLGEICVPKTLLDTMSEAEVEAVLAHELAHLERRDGVWFPVVAFIEAISWMYPITRWVSRRLRYCAELACDDRAVALTDQPLALAHALARVAERALAIRGAVLLPLIAGPSSSLLRRVERLVSADLEPAIGRAARGSRWAIACVAVCGCGLSAIRLELREGESPASADVTRVEGAAAASGAAAPAQASAIALELAELRAREREVEGEIDRLSSDLPLSSSAGESPRLLELEQELRHAREMRAFLERSAERAEPWREVKSQRPR